MFSWNDRAYACGNDGDLLAARLLWQGVWGEHLHHGYYPSPAPVGGGRLTLDEHKAAQVRMIDEVS